MPDPFKGDGHNFDDPRCSMTTIAGNSGGASSVTEFAAGPEPNRLRHLPQIARRRRRLWLELRNARLVFRGELEQSLFGERIRLFGEAAAAFCLFLQGR